MKKHSRNRLRNIAIIAHVDHGKTTLLDQMFSQCGLFRKGQDVQERILDRLDLERERGITIAAKNCSIRYRQVKMNIVDTPGHADFGGEVERALSMVDGALLLVDAAEGPLPQTRFVLQKALAARLPMVVIINKVDRKDARPEAVLDEIYDLFIDLDADEDQLDFPLFYAVGREGIASADRRHRGKDLKPILDAMIDYLPAPAVAPDDQFRMLVSDLDYSDFMGRLAVGKVVAGSSRLRDDMFCIGADGQARPLKVTSLQLYEGLALSEAAEVQAGDIVVLSGIQDVLIGDTICKVDSYGRTPEPLPRLRVDEPTVSMSFGINTSPLVGKEGRHVQARSILDRLHKETLRDVSIVVENDPHRDTIEVKGRGELQLAILIETMRREGYELSVGRTKVILKRQAGQTLEPLERVYVDCPDEHQGIVTEKLLYRRGSLETMKHGSSDRVRLEFVVPSRGLIGYRNEFLTDTRGQGVLHRLVVGYGPFRGEFESRNSGSLVSDRAGKAVAYGLFHLQPRGRLFVRPNDVVYEGMIVGEHNRSNDLNINPCREKKLTNLRAAGKDENVILTPVQPPTLEQALQFIRDDERVEVTPKSIRMHKQELQANKRKGPGSRM